MNRDDINTQNLGGEIPQRAVSIFGQNEGMDDFPVLKAFQQYIDAEQEKARKRIIGLGIFFGAILVIVIVVFMVLLHGINTRNQALSDRLVEYAMKEADRRQAPVAQPTQQDTAALKAMTETLVSIQQKLQNAEARPVAVDAQHERKVREDTDKIERAKKLLEQEKQRLDAEKERLRQIEIDRQRRKLYPELYDEDGNESYGRKSPSRSKSRNLTDEDIREIIREAYSDSTDAKRAATKSKKAERMEESLEEDRDLDGAIEYFKDDDYIIPVDIKGSSSKVKFTVPVD